MLYDRWRQIAGSRRNEVALHDLATGRRWTFAELIVAGELRGGAESPIVYPSGISSDFILGVLRAWRSATIVCPLETGQARPHFVGFPERCVHLKTTSATTGSARAIAFTAGQLMADAENLVATMGLRPDWPNLGVISLAHSYGFSSLVLPLLLHGIPLVLLNTPLPEALRRPELRETAITLPAVPALWRAWHEAKAIPSNVRLAISAGAPLSLPLEHDIFDATGIKIHNFYGASECGGIAYDRMEAPRRDATAIGSPVENVQVSVDADGCLIVEGQAVGQTYWPEPASTLAGGVYRTSDLAEFRDGVVCLRGRVTDLINVAGRKVRPETIEQTLLQHPQVTECLAFGVPSAETERTETIVVCVARKSEVALETLREFLLARLPAWQVPREWAFVESLQVNQRGKLSRADWRRWFLDRKTG